VKIPETKEKEIKVQAIKLLQTLGQYIMKINIQKYSDYSIIDKKEVFETK
jgi:hypothetical protein